MCYFCANIQYCLQWWRLKTSLPWLRPYSKKNKIILKWRIYHLNGLKADANILEGDLHYMKCIMLNGVQVTIMNKTNIEIWFGTYNWFQRKNFKSEKSNIWKFCCCYWSGSDDFYLFSKNLIHYFTEMNSKADLLSLEFSQTDEFLDSRYFLWNQLYFNVHSIYDNHL